MQNAKPQHVILIAGESLAPYHMSLYGYDKHTNPNLEKLQDDSLLVVFPNIKSPYVSTNISFSLMFTTSLAQGKDYYECYTLPEIMRGSGYTTSWYSMQNEVGYCDVGVTEFAYLCDSNKFLAGRITALNPDDYMDELIMPEIRRVAEADTSGHYFTVVHLMGQHEGFDKRFPNPTLTGAGCQVAVR